MKNKEKKFFPMSLCGLFLLLSGIACQKNEKISSIGDTSIPISLSTQISQIETRFTGSGFETDDRIGLYVLEQPKELSEERYADNIPFTYDGENWNSENLYYPKGEGKNTLLAYYPYQDNLLAAGISTVKYQVKNDQQNTENYLCSDFLVAKAIDITAREEAVTLNFKHKLSVIEIELLPGNLFANVQELMDASPTLTLKGIKTCITYDFQTDNYSSPENEQDIRPYGNFTVQEGKLTGKSAIIVPQTLDKGKPLMELKVGEKIFLYTLPEEQVIRNTTRNVWTITLKKTEISSEPACTITTQITDWENGLHILGDMAEENNPEEIPSGNYSVSIPDFSESSVYKVMSGPIQLAEICREYLYLEGSLNQEAITVYPVQNGKTNLEQGLVVQILSKHAGSPLSSACHGGRMTWDLAQNKLSTYKEGNQEASTLLYINEAGNLSFSSPANTKPATLDPYTVTDTRDQKIYPIVKIGTQYWMGENLKATQLTDNTSIGLKNSSSAWQSGLEEKDLPICCKVTSSEEILYNYATVTSGKIAPQGWKVPETEDWNKLMAYIQNNASVLKNQSWENGTNLTGFSLLDTKNRNDTGGYENAVNLWSNSKSFVIFYEDKIQWAQGSTGGKSIRCLKQ